MAPITVSTVIEAPPDVVWADIRDLASHVSWMADARAIRFVGDQREGVGTRFDCETRVGPFRLNDRMAVTEWVEGRVIGVRHEGAVSGEGRFVLSPAPGGATELLWSERLTFPLWLGGGAAASAARVVFRALWARNLRALKRRIEERDV